MEHDPLIYGKASIECIVGIEPKDANTELFIQSPDGSIVSQFISNRYWLLSSSRLDSSFIKLKGNLHYQWGRQFTSKSEFGKFRNIYKKRDVFCIYNDKEAQMVKDGLVYYRGLSPRSLGILSFDIETTGLDPNAEDAKLLLISTTFRQSDRVVKKLFAYDEFESEGQFITAFCDYVREIDPSIILGHNIVGYDLNYMLVRADNAGVNMYLGRDGSKMLQSKYESDFRVDGSRDMHYKKLRIYGREIIDTMFLAYRHDIGKKYESYGLKPIIKHEKLEKPNRTFYDASQIRFNYKDPVEWAKIKEYCIDDSDDAIALYDLMVPAPFYFTQICPKPFQGMIEGATGSQINAIMIRSYLQEGHSLPKASDVTPFEGGISMGNPGIYSNVLKVDVKSMYPSIMIEDKVYCEPKDPKKNFLRLVQTLTSERIKNKKLAKQTGEQRYTDLEQSQKIGINSAYGFLGTPGLNFNYPYGAAHVTRRGREILTKAIVWATGSEPVILENS